MILPDNDFQTSSTESFLKHIYFLEAWKSTEDIKFRLHIIFYIWTQYDIKNCSGHLIGTSSKCHKFVGQNFIKISWKRWKTEFYNFLSLEVLILEILYLTSWNSSWYDIRKNQNGSSKTQATLLAEMFCIFECLLIQNQTNQVSKLP